MSKHLIAVALIAGLFAAPGKGRTENKPSRPGQKRLKLSGKEDAVKEAAAVLNRLDRRSRSLVIEVLIVEMAKPAEGGKSEAGDEGLDAQAFSGPAEAVVAKVQALRRKGQLARVERIRLSTLEGQQASAQISENRPY